LTSHQFHIHPKPTRHFTNHCLILHPMLSSYLCRMLVGWYSGWSEVTVGKPNLWLCLLLKVARLKHINTWELHTVISFLAILEISSIAFGTGENHHSIHLAGDPGGKTQTQTSASSMG
jgi:hypothetical protein